MTTLRILVVMMLVVVGCDNKTYEQGFEDGYEFMKPRTDSYAVGFGDGLRKRLRETKQ